MGIPPTKCGIVERDEWHSTHIVSSFSLKDCYISNKGVAVSKEVNGP